MRLSVSEVPRWRALTSFGGAASVWFRIRGAHWRIVSTVSHAKHCTLLVFSCHHSSIDVLRQGSSSAVTSFQIGDGTGEQRVFTTGPGVYRLTFQPGSGATKWTIRVQDDY